MRCPYQCHEVGGPWIEENPDCPVHGRTAQDEIAQARRTAEYWKAEHNEGNKVIDQLISLTKFQEKTTDMLMAKVEELTQENESLKASVYGLYKLERRNAELIEALEQIIDLPEDSRIPAKVARRALAKVQGNNQ